MHHAAQLLTRKSVDVQAELPLFVVRHGERFLLVRLVISPAGFGAFFRLPVEEFDTKLKTKRKYTAINMTWRERISKEKSIKMSSRFTFVLTHN